MSNSYGSCNNECESCYYCPYPNPCPVNREKALELFTAKVDKLVNECNVPGLAVSICHCNEVILEEGYGVRNLEPIPDPVDTSTIFQLGGTTLAMLAVWYSSLAFQGEICSFNKVFRLGDARFLGEEMAFEATVSQTMSHALHFKRKFSQTTTVNAQPGEQSFLEGSLKFAATNPVNDPFNKYMLSLTSVNNEYIVPHRTADLTGTFLSSDTLTLLNSLWSSLGMSSVVYGKTGFEAVANRAIPLVRKNCEWFDNYVYDYSEMLFATGASASVEDLTTFMKLVLNNGTLPLDPDPLQIYNSVNSEAMLFGKNRDLIPPDADAAERVLRKLSEKGDDTSPVEYLTGLPGRDINDWYNTEGWKARYYNGQLFHYATGFLESGNNSVIMINKKFNFGISILTNSLNPYPEALAIYAYYLFVEYNSTRAEEEFCKSVMRTNNYILLRTPRDPFNPGAPLVLEIDPVGKWFNELSGLLEVTSGGPGIVNFKWLDYAAVPGTNLGNNWWEFTYTDDSLIERLFKIVFTFNASGNDVNAAARTYSGEMSFTKVPDINNLCGSLANTNKFCFDSCYIKSYNSMYGYSHRCKSCGYIQCICCNSCSRPCGNTCGGYTGYRNLAGGSNNRGINRSDIKKRGSNLEDLKRNYTTQKPIEKTKRQNKLPTSFSEKRSIKPNKKMYILECNEEDIESGEIALEDVKPVSEGTAKLIKGNKDNKKHGKVAHPKLKKINRR